MEFEFPWYFFGSMVLFACVILFYLLYISRVRALVLQSLIRWKGLGPNEDIKIGMFPIHLRFVFFCCAFFSSASLPFLMPLLLSI